jgi:hypothetical protein
LLRRWLEGFAAFSKNKADVLFILVSLGVYYHDQGGARFGFDCEKTDHHQRKDHEGEEK